MRADQKQWITYETVQIKIKIGIEVRKLEMKHQLGNVYSMGIHNNHMYKLANPYMCLMPEEKPTTCLEPQQYWNIY